MQIGPKLVRFKYLQDNGIMKDRVALQRAEDLYGFPKAISLGANTRAWYLEEVEDWLRSRPRTEHAKSKPNRVDMLAAEVCS
jgi:predicted DNA-binding transcriptional regulator AlpA